MENSSTYLNNGQGAHESILTNLYKSISQPYLFPDADCQIIEAFVQDVIKQSNNGFYKQHTIDRALLRNKYFFGERYTYGSQTVRKGLGMERLYPKESVDPIPLWIYCYVINPLVEAKIIQENFVNSAVINEYQPGGCIVSHIDPPHIFDRPIVSVNLFSDSALCFGCKFEFKPIRCSEPVLRVALPKGIVTLISDFAANEITHCVRPEDTKSYRAVILLRRVLPDAPRLSPLDPYLITNDTAYVASQCKVGFKKLNGEAFKKFYEKYSKSCKGKRNHGGISKPLYTRKTFFADNKRFANKPYTLNDE